MLPYADQLSLVGSLWCQMHEAVCRTAEREGCSLLPAPDVLTCVCSAGLCYWQTERAADGPDMLLTTRQLLPGSYCMGWLCRGLCINSLWFAMQWVDGIWSRDHIHLLP